jgi:hypothetical protein
MARHAARHDEDVSTDLAPTAQDRTDLLLVTGERRLALTRMLVSLRTHRLWWDTARLNHTN